MNPDNIAPWLYLAGDHGTLDPATAGTFDVKRSPSVCPMVLASVTATETRTLGRPTHAGAILTLYVQGPASITTGTITLTVTGGYNTNAATTLIFSAQGQWATFMSFYDGTNYYWDLVSSYIVGNGAAIGLSGTASFVNAVATLAVTKALHAGKIITLGVASGFTCTLPLATGTGDLYRFMTTVTITSNNYIIDRGTALDIISGLAVMAQTTNIGTSSNTFASASNTNRITMNGSTKGGVIGDYIALRDVATNQWILEACNLNSSGTAVTPFDNH